MRKIIFAIYAPFECKGCEKAKKYLPKFCEENEWEYRIINKEKTKEFNTDTYPTILAAIDDEIVFTMEGFSLKELKHNLNKY